MVVMLNARLHTSVMKCLPVSHQTESPSPLPDNLEVKFERFDLVICDELGYVGFDK